MNSESDNYEVIYRADDDDTKANNPPITISHTHEKHIQTKHNIKNPNFFDIDKISNDYVTNHNKKNIIYFFLNVTLN